jgi:hypothetical protein
LSSKNGQLEDQLRAMPETLEALTAARKQVDVLLVMLGEKEEELEATIGDIKEVKFLYRRQLDELLIAATNESPHENMVGAGGAGSSAEQSLQHAAGVAAK